MKIKKLKFIKFKPEEASERICEYSAKIGKNTFFIIYSFDAGNIWTIFKEFTFSDHGTSEIKKVKGLENAKDFCQKELDKFVRNLITN